MNCAAADDPDSRRHWHALPSVVPEPSIRLAEHASPDGHVPLHVVAVQPFTSPEHVIPQNNICGPLLNEICSKQLATPGPV